MHDEKTHTIYELLTARAEHAPQAVALHAPSRGALTYRGLLSHVESVVRLLIVRGVHRGDRVAIVLPNGPEIAAAFLGVASTAICAPLNPAYSRSEFDFYLSDLNPKALIVQSGMNSAAIAVAEERGISIIELLPKPAAAAGIFELSDNEQPATADFRFSQADDIALILPTSGTTSRPKMVPLTHANLLTSAGNIASTLRLTEADRCLNVMPLFHIHGLVGALLSSVMVGSSVVCASGFDLEQFFPWLEAFSPTWYTAVPTIHHAVLSRAHAVRTGRRNHSLRLIRSSSAALPVRVLRGLEELFEVPVIESYGMTEAAHQMASNPLPPAEHKPGSVGKAAGPEIAIMDDEGNLQPAGTTGEVVIRGANVMEAYEGGSDANITAFTRGWFKTGDQGYLDGDGYLFLTGRIKELINRGGDKIAPREIDDVLLAHPAVDQAVAFGVPHPTLGEEVAAVVVLRPESQATVRELKEFSAAKLAAFKVPKQIAIVNEIPKNATGKLQRLGLAEKLTPQCNVAGGNNYYSELERTVAHIFAEVLGVEHVSSTDHFFALGGDSLRATQVIARIHATLDVNLSIATILLHSTVRELAHVIQCVIATTDDLWSTYPSSVVPFQANGSKPPLFWFNWGPWEFCVPRYLGSDQPVYGLQHQSQDGHRALYTSIEAIAAYYIKEMRAVQSKGPYFLGGLCIGGMVVFEMARQLQQQGEEVALLVLLDPRNHCGELSSVQKGVPPLTSHITWFRNKVYRLLRDLAPLGPQEKLSYALVRVEDRIMGLREKFSWIGRRVLCESFGRPLPPSFRTQYIVSIYDRAARAYAPKLYRGRVIIFKTQGRYSNGILAWGELIAEGLEIQELDTDHDNVFKEPYVQIFTERLKAHLSEAQRHVTGRRNCR